MFCATFLVGQRTLGVTNYVGRPDGADCMPVQGLAIPHRVIHPVILRIRVQGLLVDKHVVLQGEIAGTHVQLFVTQGLVVLI